MATITVPNSETRRKFSPPQLARVYGVDPGKILAWIRSGELRAINGSIRTGGRPRYLIDLADIALFEQRRATVPPPKATRRRRRSAPGVTEFFDAQGNPTS